MIAVDSIEQASETLEPLAGPLAQFLFGIALLFAGGIFFLSTPGLEWAASIARDFTVFP